jgi:hypothetical protein
LPKAARRVRRVDQVAVALDVAALAADDVDDRLLVERVRHTARGRGLGVEEPALAELPRLPRHVDPDAAAVDEVELVLEIVVVVEALEVRRVDDRVDAERGDAERRADLPEAGPLAELVER